MAKTLQELQKIIVQFRDERGWKKHHHPKDLAISIAVEAAELLECFQWGDHAEIKSQLSDQAWKDEISLELADILIYILSFSDQLEIDLADTVLKKLAINRKRFPKDEMKKISKQEFLLRRKEMRKRKKGR